MARRPVKGALLPVEGGGAPPVEEPQRIMRAFSFKGGIFGRGRFEWKPGEVITDPEEIAYLREQGVMMQPVTG